MGFTQRYGGVVMFALLKNRVWLRIITVFTIATFLPSAAGAWNFFPPEPDADETEAQPNPWLVLPWVTADEASTAAYAQLPWRTADVAPDTENIRPPLRLANLDTPVAPAETVDVAKSTGAAPADSLEVQGYRPVQLARVTGGLPDAHELLANLTADVSATTDAPNQSVVVAQLAPDTSGPSLTPGTAEYQVAEAEAMFDQGDYVNAGLAYLSLANQYPETEAAAEADRGLSRIMKGTLNGTVSFSEIDEVHGPD